MVICDMHIHMHKTAVTEAASCARCPSAPDMLHVTRQHTCIYKANMEAGIFIPSNYAVSKEAGVTTDEGEEH